MRSVFLTLLVFCMAAAPAAAQTTGPTGPVIPNPAPPTAAGNGATDVTQTAATVKARVDPNNGETQVQLQYGTSSNYGVTSASQTVPTGDDTVDLAFRIERLTSATTYHYRVVATNAAGVARSSDRTFTTASNPSKPSIASVAAKDVTSVSATLQARVDPNRQATGYVFEYGTSTRYGLRSAAGDAGAGDSGLPVAVGVSGLKPNTTYYFRLRATNPSGTTLGGNRSFKTGKQALGLAASLTPSVVRYTRTLTINGAVTGTDKSGVPVALERRNFPFTAGFAPFGNQQLTNSSGVVQFLVPPFTMSSQFRLTAASRGGLTSNIVTAQVRALVKLRVRRIGKGRLSLSGQVSPANATGLVSIQRRGANGKYVVVRRAGLKKSGGVQRFRVTLRTRAQASVYRAATRLTGGALVDGRSPIIRVRGGK